MNRSLGLLLALLALLNAALLTEIGLESRNTLEHHPEWVLGKSLLRHPPEPYGTRECAETRELLARNRLNLSVWRGFQEVLLQREVKASARLSFRFRLADNAYLALILGRQSDGYQAVVVSRNPQFPSVVAQVENGGRFTSTEPLGWTVGPGWHRCRVEGEQMTLDGQSRPLSRRDGVIGFRGSLAPAEVDSVEIDGRACSFRNDAHRWAVGLHCAALVAVLTGLALLYHLRRQPLHQALLWTCLLLFTGLLALLFYWFVDVAIWSTRYCENEPPEKVRLALAGTLAGVDPAPSASAWIRGYLRTDRVEWPGNNIRVGDLQVEDTAAGVRAYRAAHPKSQPCLLLLGASQLWGEGTARAGEDIASNLPGWEVINAARRGTFSGPLLERYRDHLALFEPDRVLLYLGNNDSDPRALEERLKGFHGLLVLEAASWEAPPDANLSAEHQAMQRSGLPCLDLDSYLRQPEQVHSGFLWWDMVHPTSHGHALIARYLKEHL